MNKKGDTIMRKVILCYLLCASLMIGAAGCSTQTPSQEVASQTKAFTAEEIKASQTTGAVAEQNNIVFQYVSNSVQIDKDKLVAVEKTDADRIKSAITEINEALRTGETVKKNGVVETKPTTSSTAESSGSSDGTSETSESSAQVAEVNQKSDVTIISDSIANYMLHNFAKSPFTWKMNDCKIVGMDSATHLYFVDVYYETTGEKKTVLPESIITKGEPGYSELCEKRQEDYNTLMTYAVGGIESNKEYQDALKSFKAKWGDIDVVAKSMEFESPLDYTRLYGKAKTGIGCYAYSGITNTHEVTGAKMVYRYVMGYNYNVNDELRIEPKAVYMYNYSVNNGEDLKKKYTATEINAEEVLNPLVNKLIYSYSKAMDECDNNGLYKIYKSYNKYDTEVNAYNEFAYHKYGTYLYNILGRDNDKLFVEVTFSNKERTKGSAMSEATYKDTLLVTLTINEDDTLTLIDTHLLNRVLIGEPLSVIEKVTGVSEQINYSENAFTASNEEAIKKAITNFMKLELTKNFNSDVFTTCIDLGISNSELDNIKKTINSVDVDEVTTWITGYTTKSNLYVNATLREVYKGTENGSQSETAANIGLINRNGNWFVVSYTRTMNVKLTQGTTVSDEKCLEHYIIKDNNISSLKKEVAKVVSEGEGANEGSNVTSKN